MRSDCTYGVKVLMEWLSFFNYASFYLSNRAADTEPPLQLSGGRFAGLPLI